MKSLGQSIKDNRTKNNMSQQELGDILGVSNRTISKWENDVHKPDPNILTRLSELFNISVDDLLSVKKEPNDSDYKTFRELLMTINNLDSFKRRLMNYLVIIILLLISSIIFAVSSMFAEGDSVYMFIMLGIISTFVLGLILVLLVYKNLYSLQALHFSKRHDYLFNNKEESHLEVVDRKKYMFNQDGILIKNIDSFINYEDIKSPILCVDKEVFGLKLYIKIIYDNFPYYLKLDKEAYLYLRDKIIFLTDLNVRNDQIILTNYNYFIKIASSILIIICSALVLVFTKLIDLEYGVFLINLIAGVLCYLIWILVKKHTLIINEDETTYSDGKNSITFVTEQVEIISITRMYLYLKYENKIYRIRKMRGVEQWIKKEDL